MPRRAESRRVTRRKADLSGQQGGGGDRRERRCGGALDARQMHLQEVLAGMGECVPKG